MRVDHFGRSRSSKIGKKLIGKDEILQQIRKELQSTIETCKERLDQEKKLAEEKDAQTKEAMQGLEEAREEAVGRLKDEIGSLKASHAEKVSGLEEEMRKVKEGSEAETPSRERAAKSEAWRVFSSNVRIVC